MSESESESLSPTTLYFGSAQLRRLQTLFFWGDNCFVGIIHTLGPFVVVDTGKSTERVTTNYSTPISEVSYLKLWFGAYLRAPETFGVFDAQICILQHSFFDI